MQIRKQQANAQHFCLTQFSASVMTRQTPAQRAERKHITTEGKQKINSMHRRIHLQQLICLNFTTGKDLFIELDYAEAHTPADCEKLLAKFHRTMRRYFAKYGAVYRYICTTETHSRDGEPVRPHHHAIVSHIQGTDMLGLIQDLWKYGGADVRTLREFTTGFEDTAIYLLKERKPCGKRAYSTSRNLRQPNPPIRTKHSETARAEVPQGVTAVQHEVRENAFGRYEIMTGRIYDQRAFARYWKQQQAQDISDRWRRTRHALQPPHGHTQGQHAHLGL